MITMTNLLNTDLINDDMMKLVRLNEDHLAEIGITNLKSGHNLNLQIIDALASSSTTSNLKRSKRSTSY